MILQFVNTISGFVLAAPKLKEFFGGKAAEHISTAETKLASFRGTLGTIDLVFGALALFMRVGFMHGGTFGASFPQAFAALACGALLSPSLAEKFPSMKSVIEKLKPYEVWVGMGALFVGLGSILFGCVAPVCYPLSF